MSGMGYAIVFLLSRGSDCHLFSFPNVLYCFCGHFCVFTSYVIMVTLSDIIMYLSPIFYIGIEQSVLMEGDIYTLTADNFAVCCFQGKVAVIWLLLSKNLIFDLFYEIT